MTSRRVTWTLSIGLVALAGCQREEPPPAEDPFADPWVDGIDTGEQAPAVAVDDPTPIPEPSAVEPTSTDEAVAVAVAEQPDPNPDPAAIEAPTPGPDSPASKPAKVSDAPATPDPAATPDPNPTPDAQPVAPTPSAAPAPAPEGAAPPPPPPITAADFDGNYRFVGGQAERDGVADAIDTTAAALASALQGIARKRLTEVNPIEGKLDITVVGDKVTTTFESGFTVTAVIGGGTATAKALDGSKLDVKLSAKDNKLVQSMVGKGGGRTIVYVLSADRKRLTVHTKITSNRLPVPLTYRLSFTRK